MRWKILPKKSNDLVEQLLINRGINDKERFFNPKISDYEKDLQIAGIDKAHKRINQAIDNNELIVVYGDYDVDGICASAILYKGLVSIGAKVLPYIPHREKEGYGLSKIGLEFAKESGATVVITVDLGIVAFEQANFAKSLGLDLIITDHHLPQGNLPDCFAIVHSTKMCGAAVAWCLTRDVIKKELSCELLQFVAIATVCDLIPLIGLGRAFVSEGLKILNKDLLRRTLPSADAERRTTNLGLRILIEEAGIKGPIGSYEIGYMLGPRLNAMGRLEHAIDSLRLLCTKDPIKAKRLAKLLSDTNCARQQMTIDAVEEAKALVDRSKNIHILYSKKWSAGIIGLVAGRITQECSRPTIAIAVGESISKGSARSIDGINIVELIRKHTDILIDIGGHPGAAGFSLESKYIETFRKRLEEHVIELKEVEKVLEIEAEIAAKQLSKHLLLQLQKFEPFGLGNPRPILTTFAMKLSDIKTVGNGKHLKFKLDGIDAIAFGMGGLSCLLRFGQLINVAYILELNNFNGNSNLQLKVKDIQIV